MCELNEILAFESKFQDDIIEIAAVIGASGATAGRAGKDTLWTGSIELIAWKNLSADEKTKIGYKRLQWLEYDEEWKKIRDILKKDMIVRLMVRNGEKSLMLVKILDTEHKDDELESILQDSKMPIFYYDEQLGKFKLNKRIKLFKKEITWSGENGSLYFHSNEDKLKMDSALETARVLIKDQDNWNNKIKDYASEKLIEQTNDWLQEDEDGISEITKEMFIDLLSFDGIIASPGGKFKIIFYDGEMFGGHSVVVQGNINGQFEYADIEG